MADSTGGTCHVDGLQGGEVCHTNMHGGVLILRGREGSTVQDLDALSLVHIMSYLGEASLRACSLVCHAWLDSSNFAKDSLNLRGVQQICSLPKALSRFSDLRYVKLKDFDGIRRWKPRSEWDPPACLDDVFLRVLARGCPCLLSLSLVRCGIVSDEGLAAIVQGCPKLETLHISECEVFSGAAFKDVQCRLKNLCLLSCSVLRTSGLLAMAEAWFTLQNLEVRMDGESADLAACSTRWPSSVPSLTGYACKLAGPQIPPCADLQSAVPC